MKENLLNILSFRKELADSYFEGAYNKLISGNTNDLTDEEKHFLLKTAVVLLNQLDFSLERLGYRIILSYSNAFESYIPLYDVSINKGFIPISKFIESQHISSKKFDDSFFNTLFSSYKETFLQNGIYLSEGQRDLIKFANSNEGNFVLIAPTSYGKSDIIINKAKSNNSKKVCIVVPSKSLLSQTKRRLLKDRSNNQFSKIITHPDMYSGSETSFLAVLTQERLLRLLQKNPELSLDLILIDEAHNLLKGDNRSILLTQVLLINKKRNTNSIFNFFTPFISNAKNLSASYTDNNLVFKRSDEFLKIEKYFSIDILTDGILEIYDQFTNRFIFIKKHLNATDFKIIDTYKADKNIVYLNKPRDIEQFATSIPSNDSDITNKGINDLISSISEYIHPEYNLILCIKKGILYHHGSMPDIIRLYVENAFSTYSYFNFIITNSTLLEGVDIPADKLFILTTKIGNRNFKKSEFKNLSGRICRFSEVFNNSKGNLNRLEPQIYIIKGNYSDKSSNIKGFIEKTLKSNLIISDNVDNILLKDKEDLSDPVDIKKLDDITEYLENIEPNTISAEGIFYAESRIAQLCYKNNVNDFNIKNNEEALIKNLAENLLFDINSPSYLIRGILTLFTNNIEIIDEQFKRILSLNVQRFYSMFMQWRIDALPYRTMIDNLIKYWASSESNLIYVGRRWGETNIAQQQSSYMYTHINILKKTNNELINLAIVRIKEEQDYIDNTLIKYVEIINDLGLIEASFYDKIKYGTNNKIIICFLKNGFTMELAKSLAKDIYRDYLTLDLENDIIIINPNIIQAMLDNKENQILIFEVMHHIK